MKIIGEGTVDINGHDRYYCVKEDREDTGEGPLDNIVFCIASSEALEVYTLSELFDREFDEMEFEVEEHCMVCDSDKDNCSTRIAHRLDKLEIPLSQFNGDPPTPRPEYICKDCAYAIAEFAESWAKENNNEIATRTL